MSDAPEWAYDEPDDLDQDEDEPGFDCPMWFDGHDWHCPLLGSEQCDWDCPHGGMAPE